MSDLLNPPNNFITSSSGKTWLNDDGIIIAVADEQEYHTLEQAKENTAITLTVANGKRRPFLIDMSKVKSMSRDARVYYAGTEPVKAITAVAILTNSNVGKMVANFFIGLTHQHLPTKMFTDINEAINWLQGHQLEQID